MASSFFISIISWCQPIFLFLFSKRLAGSDPTTGSKDPNADHNNAPKDVVSESSRDCCQKQQVLEHKSQTVETLTTPESQQSVDDVLRTGSSSGVASQLSGLPTQLCTTNSHHKPHKLQLFSKMFQTARSQATPLGASPISSPQSILNSNLNDATNRLNTMPDLTGQLDRTSSYATSFGGLSDIWRCIWNKNGSSVVVAVKSIRSQALDEKDVKRKNRRLRRELKVWSRLRHVNIVPLYGTVSGFGQFVSLVCPWYDNGSLSGYLESHGETLSIIRRFQLLSDVSAGLQYLHSCSVIHGDLTGVRGWFPEFITDDDHVCSPMSSSHPMGGPIYPTLVSPL